MKYPDLFSRLLANSIESETCHKDRGPCWLFTGHLDSDGYGKIARRMAPKTKPVGRRVHREMVELVLGRPLLKAETVEHDCVVRHCIAPLHFKLMGNGENAADATSRRLGRARVEFPWLVDSRYTQPWLVRALPVLKSSLDPVCPF